jgi:hypothetical protein
MKIALDIIGDIPKLTSGDYSDLVREMKALGAHSHVQVVISAFKVQHSNILHNNIMTTVQYCHVPLYCSVMYAHTRNGLHK